MIWRYVWYISHIHWFPKSSNIEVNTHTAQQLREPRSDNLPTLWRNATPWHHIWHDSGADGKTCRFRLLIRYSGFFDLAYFFRMFSTCIYISFSRCQRCLNLWPNCPARVVRCPSYPIPMENCNWRFLCVEKTMSCAIIWTSDFFFSHNQNLQCYRDGSSIESVIKFLRLHMLRRGNHNIEERRDMTRARFLSLARSKLISCSANHRPGSQARLLK